MAQVNGDTPSAAHQSAFLSHLLDYPVVNDSVTTFRQNPYGQKSLELSDTAYKTFAQPILPYFARPYELVRPYIAKADSLGSRALDKVDETAPFVKKPTNELYAGAKGIIFLPLNTGLETKDHVLEVFSAEYKKYAGDGIFTYGKALFSTALISSSEFISWAGNVLNHKKEEAKDAFHDKANN